MSDAAHGHPVERLSAYLDDEVPVDERLELDHHLAECERCREQLEALRAIVRAVREEPVPDVPRDLAGRVANRIDAARVVPLRGRRFVVPATIAATIAAIGLIAVVTYRQGGPAMPPLPAPPEAPAGSEAPAASGPASPVEAVPPVAVAGKVAAESKPKMRATRDAATAPRGGPPVDAPSGVEGGVEGGVGGGVPGGVSGGVVGGVVGGVAEGAEGGSEADTGRKDEPAAPSRNAAAAQDRARPATTPALAPSSPARTSAEAAGAGRAAPAPCGDAWLDAGVEASWDVADRQAAVVELERLARAHGGRLELPGPGAPGLAFVIVPRARYAGFAAAAGVAGVRGLEGVAPPRTAECVRQRVTLRPAPAR